jgi:hypothetical protein
VALNGRRTHAERVLCARCDWVRSAEPPRYVTPLVGRFRLIVGFGWRALGGEHRDTVGEGCSLHAVVVGENACQIVTERQCRGKMDRVKRPQLNRTERRGGRADVIAERTSASEARTPRIVYSSAAMAVESPRARATARESSIEVTTLVARSLQRGNTSSSTSLSAARITSLTSADVSTCRRRERPSGRQPRSPRCSCTAREPASLTGPGNGPRSARTSIRRRDGSFTPRDAASRRS